MPLTEDQIVSCLSHEGDRTAMLNAAYRMGMLRAAEICDALEEESNNYRVQGTMRACADAIRAEAGE